MTYPLRIPGRQVILRDFRADDVESAHAVVGDERVTWSLSFDARSLSETATMLDGAIERAQHEPRTEFYLAVTLPPDGELVGFARLGLDGVQAAKLGYAIRADQWGHGYAKDAARTLTDYGFRELKLHRISAAIGPDNAPSVALINKLGFMYEGRVRDHVHTNGAWRDSLLFSVLRHEWAEDNARLDTLTATR